MMNRVSTTEIAQKALRNTIIMGLTGLAICSFVDFTYLLGFIAGLFIGIANLFMLYSSVQKCVLLSPDKAKRHMLISYPVRFIATMSFMGYMVWSAAISPLTLLAGFIVTLMSMVITVIYMSYRDIEPVSLPLRDS